MSLPLGAFRQRLLADVAGREGELAGPRPGSTGARRCTTTARRPVPPSPTSAKAAAEALQDLERNPAIGSPALGRLLGIVELRTWRLQGFALTFWTFDRADHIAVIRLVG